MKNIFKSIALLTLVSITMVSSPVVKADIISPDSKPVEVCMRIKNIEYFKDYKFYENSSFVNRKNSIEINSQTCLTKSEYKFAQYELVVKQGDKTFKVKGINMQDGYNIEVKKDSSIKNINIDYYIYKIDKTTVYFAKTSKITHYTDGTSKVDTYAVSYLGSKYFRIPNLNSVKNYKNVKFINGVLYGIKK